MAPVLRARALLLRALLGCPNGAAAVAQAGRDLQEACELLDGQLQEQGLGHIAARPGAGGGDDSEDDAKEQAGGQALSAAALGLLDSAALAHAQLGLWLAQQRMATSQVRGTGFSLGGSIRYKLRETYHQTRPSWPSSLLSHESSPSVAGMRRSHGARGQGGAAVGPHPGLPNLP